MADNTSIERTIYKLEIDDSTYIKGVDNLTASTQKFSQAQDAANKKLAEAKIALKAASDAVIRQQQELDNANKGSNTGIIKQRQDALKSAQVEQQKLTDLVKQTEIEYQKATKLATDFANSTAKGRIAIPPVTPQNIPQLPLGGTGLDVAVGASAAEFEQLRGAIAAAELALSEMNQESEEFKALAPAVEAGKKALADYDAAAESAGQSTVSLRTQIRQGREELVKMEQQGKANSKEYFELEQRVASLTDAYGDQQQRIKILASDTKLLDFGKASITAATAAFSAYTSVSVLAGGASEELQKKTLQLFAAMQLLQSLEQLSNLTRREGALATLAQSGAQAVYTAVVGSTTGALKAFRIALAATGVGAIIVGIGFLVSKLSEYADAAEKAAEQQKLLKEINDEAIKSFSGQVTHLTLIKNSLNDLNIPQKERIKLAKEYNKTAEEGNKIDLKQIDNIQLVNAAIESQIKVIERRARAKAAENILTQRFETLFLAQEAARQKAGLAEIRELANTQKPGPQLKVGDVLPVFDPVLKKMKQVKLSQADVDAFKKEGAAANIRIANQLQAEDVRKAIENDPAVKAAQDAVNKALSLGLINIEDLISPDVGKETKGIENEFAKKLKELQAKLAEVTAKSFESEGTIRKQFATSLAKEIQSITDSKAFTDKQKGILIDLLVKINEVQLNEALGEFNKKVLDARKKLNDELANLQKANTEESIQLLQDEFERRKQLIDFNERQQLEDAKNSQISRLEALEQEKNLIGLQAYEDAKNEIFAIGEQEQTNILIKAAQDRQQLSSDSFQKSLEFFQNAINEIDLIDDEESSKKIRALSNKFLAQKITFENFQKQLAIIERDAAAKKRDRDLIFERAELDSLDFKLTQIEDKTSEHYKRLLKQRDDQAKKVAGLETTDAINDAKDKNTDENTKKAETLNDYAQSVGQLTDSVIQFWQAANEAESAALDKSIALQEKRVTAAQRIAERGNAQYLKAEEDRLKELTIKRENAARRELAINAALQASQLLVGITGAISKIATPGIGLAESIGAFAVIVSSLAAGYGLVKSLQGSQPRLAKGDPYVKRNGHPSGIDTIPAWLNEGEAVIPTETNKKYHPAIRAIYDEKIPAEDINAFVKNYHAVKGVPRVNYDRIKESAELSVGNDGRMAVLLSEHSNLLKENNQLQREILKRKIHIENKIDRDGVSSMVTDYINQINIDKHT